VVIAPSRRHPPLPFTFLEENKSNDELSGR
jgi:hypothetical protein